MGCRYKLALVSNDGVFKLLVYKQIALYNLFVYYLLVY